MLKRLLSLSRDSPRYAAALVWEAQEAARSLSRFALRGRIVPELRNPDIREVFVGKFRLIYELKTGRVFILGFIHGARDLAGIWDAGPPGVTA